MRYTNFLVLAAFAESYNFLDQIKSWVSMNVVNVYTEPGYTAWGLAMTVVLMAFGLIWFATVLDSPLITRSREDAP
jgi:hypothetical protein